VSGLRLAVFGGTGATGRLVVERAVARGHHVTAMVRRPDALTVDRVQVLPGDVLRPGDVSAAVAGADAVISTLGPGRDLGATQVYSAGTRAIRDAMAEAGVKRLVCVSSTALESAPGTPLAVRVLHRQVLQRMLAQPFADLRVMEAETRASDLDWTIVRASRLTDGQATGRYQTGSGRHAGRGLSISRADLADYLLSCASEGGGIGSAIDIAY
jgi:putative NADH-flavin reductase